MRHRAARGPGRAHPLRAVGRRGPGLPPAGARTQPGRGGRDRGRRPCRAHRACDGAAWAARTSACSSSGSARRGRCRSPCRASSTCGTPWSSSSTTRTSAGRSPTGRRGRCREADEQTLWSYLKIAGRGLARPAGVPLRLEWGSQTATLRRGDDPVVLRGCRRSWRSCCRAAPASPRWRTTGPPTPSRRCVRPTSASVVKVSASSRHGRLESRYRFVEGGHTPQSAHGHTNGARALQASAVPAFPGHPCVPRTRGARQASGRGPG